ncbi:MAG: ribonuclease-3 [Candidatus Azotimanducaceae bacterium]|jgi:ribonuclease-3|tara:strand:- start:5417 stop:6178 length:762 start_codon:yes stop_codon:yes gene_type:complete
MSELTSGSSENLQVLQSKLGYTFSRIDLLKLALTHKSFSKTNNERLEFVGDAVLGYLVGSRLFLLYPEVQEDALSLMRAKLVRGKMLAEVARGLDLSSCLRLGSGELKTGGSERASILADALEAIVGAVHEDGGIGPCSDLVDLLFTDLMQGLEAEVLKDPKTRLQEHLQAQGLDLPTYEVVDICGADHQRQFTVSCAVPMMGLQCTSQALSRRAAEKAAASEVLILIAEKMQIAESVGPDAAPINDTNKSSK